MSAQFSKKQLQTAQALHDAGQRWYDGPELFNATVDGTWLGIGSREELDALKADDMLPAESIYTPVTPADMA